MRKIWVLSAGLVLFAVPLLPQTVQSLGEIARQYRAEKAEPASPAVPPGNSVSQTAPASQTKAPLSEGGVDDVAIAGQKQINDYMSRVRYLVRQEQFDELDAMAAEARSKKERLPGGGWKLFTFYSVVGKTPGATFDADWIAHLDRLRRWISSKPSSITARVALADAYLSYAWKARGNGYADSVTDEGQKLFEERTQLARETLEQAAALKENCPQWYRVMQTVAQAQGWSKTEANALLEKAVAFEPDYYYYYQAHANYLLPKWYGEEGEAEAFADAIATRLGGKLGDITYYKTVRSMLCDCGEQDASPKMSWTRIKAGYTANQREYGVSMYELNAFAQMSVKFRDLDGASNLFTRIGEHWDEDVWHNQKYFDDTKAWVSNEISVRNQALAQIDSAVNNNLQTTEGRAYDATISKEFAQNFSSAMNGCVKQAGDDLQDFTLYLQVGKDGKIGAIVPHPLTAVDACLAPKVYASKLSVPPTGAYWVRISMNLKP